MQAQSRISEFWTGLHEATTTTTPYRVHSLSQRNADYVRKGMNETTQGAKDDYPTEVISLVQLSERHTQVSPKRLSTRRRGELPPHGSVKTSGGQRWQMSVSVPFKTVKVRRCAQSCYLIATYLILNNQTWDPVCCIYYAQPPRKHRWRQIRDPHSTGRI